MKHKVKTHNWIAGTLRAREYLFESLEDAMRFLLGRNNHSAKIFNEHGHMVHEANYRPNEDSYA